MVKALMHIETAKALRELSNATSKEMGRRYPRHAGKTVLRKGQVE
jgi:hypothetical protein